jgi:hypothetical protein
MTNAQKSAETLALQALAWVAADDEVFGSFLGATGADADALRVSASDPVFLASVLDFLMQQDAWVIGFCRSAGLPFDALMQARRSLPGGGDPHWT